jgi:CheY-like chemotaxis protein
MSTIAIIDDNLVDLRYAASCLRRAGHEGVEVHPSGTAQLVKLVLALRRLAPDLILLDYHLPGIPTDFLAQLCREDKQLFKVPILLLTAGRDLEHAPRLQQVSPAGILFKPCQPDSLVKAVENLLATPRHSGLAHPPEPDLWESWPRAG